MKETILTIAKWSEETFGDNITLEGQLEKYEDEFGEWLDSDRNDIMELADMAIVTISIARFSITDALRCFGEIKEEACYSNFNLGELEEAIKNKMKINRQRKWSIGKGNFQHISEGEEE